MNYFFIFETAKNVKILFYVKNFFEKIIKLCSIELNLHLLTNKVSIYYNLTGHMHHLCHFEKRILVKDRFDQMNVILSKHWFTLKENMYETALK